jgi:hypothetical protein
VAEEEVDILFHEVTPTKIGSFLGIMKADPLWDWAADVRIVDRPGAFRMSEKSEVRRSVCDGWRAGATSAPVAWIRGGARPVRFKPVFGEVGRAELRRLEDPALPGSTPGGGAFGNGTIFAIQP